MPSWFLVAAPGLEPVVAKELDRPAEVVPGGVRWEASIEDGLKAARSLRTPTRLLLELAKGKANSLRDLGDRVAEIDWSPFLDPRMALDVQVSAEGSKVGRKDVIAKKVKNVVATRIRRGRPGAPLQAQTIFVRLLGDAATVSLDVGGLLHRRGWRTEQGKAPLRENLAASMLFVAGYDGARPLLDPFCGSGTLPIEGALLALGRSPFKADRDFASDDWPAARSLSRARTPARTLAVSISGSDSHPQEVERAQRNAERAQVGVSFAVKPVDLARPPSPETGLVVANPPYGERLGKEVRGVYAAFGRTFREHFEGWDLVFLAPDDGLAQLVHKGAVRVTTFPNGGLRVGLYAFEATDL